MMIMMIYDNDDDDDDDEMIMMIMIMMRMRMLSNDNFVNHLKLYKSEVRIFWSCLFPSTCCVRIFP